MASSQQSLTMAATTKVDLLGDEFLVEFINDTLSFYLKNHRVPFLTKYSEILGGGHNVVPVRSLVIDLVKICLRKTTMSSTVDLFKQAIVDHLESLGFDFTLDPLPISKKTIDILANSIFAKRQEM